MLIKLTLDRIEGDIAYCYDENENLHKISKDILQNVKEGEIFICEFENGEYKLLSIEKEETEKKKSELKTRLNNLFNKKR